MNYILVQTMNAGVLTSQEVLMLYFRPCCQLRHDQINQSELQEAFFFGRGGEEGLLLNKHHLPLKHQGESLFFCCCLRGPRRNDPDASSPTVTHHPYHVDTSCGGERFLPLPCPVKR